MLYFTLLTGGSSIFEYVFKRCIFNSIYDSECLELTKQAFGFFFDIIQMLFVCFNSYKRIIDTLHLSSPTVIVVMLQKNIVTTNFLQSYNNTE